MLISTHINITYVQTNNKFAFNINSGGSKICHWLRFLNRALETNSQMCLLYMQKNEKKKRKKNEINHVLAEMVRQCVHAQQHKCRRFSVSCAVYDQLLWPSFLCDDVECFRTLLLLSRSICVLICMPSDIYVSAAHIYTMSDRSSLLSF